MNRDDAYRKTIVGRSKSGQHLVRYKSSIGRKVAVDERFSQFVLRRQNVFVDMFGEWRSVFHEMIPLDPYIEIFEFPPNYDANRNHYTYVTSGISNLRMNSPPELGSDVRRVEIVFYASDSDREYVSLLHDLAAYVLERQAWIHWGHSMPNGTPPTPLIGTRFDHLFFMPPLFSPDDNLAHLLTLGGDPVNLLWCVPLTQSECQFKLDNGTDALYDLFDQHQHPFVYDRNRDCYA